MIDPRAIQQVKDATRIEEVLGEFVNLKRKGPRYLGLCPFHNEKTPSFNVSPALGIFKCFGCGEAGDAITFLQKHEHLGYIEAIRWLARRYQIELPEEAATPEQALEQSERESLAVIQAWAQQWSADHLWSTDEGRRIGLSYFHERGFRDEIIRQFGLGYVPEQGNAFAIAALAHGFQADLLEKAGWIKRRDDGTPWDFFQGRVTFPVHGLSGQVIAFGARTLKSDKKLPKYFNSPESVLYVKGRSLYGMHVARKAIVEAGTCLLVEGYTDVISLHQCGVTNVVASSGTSLTEDQVRLIKRYAPGVTILYDGDPAGIKASLRGIDMILAEGLGVKVVLFPDGEDPDSFARTRTSGEVREFISTNAKDFLVFKTDLLVKDAEGDPVAKATAIRDIVESIARVPDHVLRALYIQQCGKRLGVAEQALISEMNKVLRLRFRKKVGGDQAAEELPAPEVRPARTDLEELGTRPQEKELLRLLINYGHVEVAQVYDEFKEGATPRALTVGEWIYSELEEDEMKIYDALVKNALFGHRDAFARDAKERLTYFLAHPDGDLRQLVMELSAEPHLLADWKRHRIHVHQEDHDLQLTVKKTLRRYKERYVDQLLAEKLDAIRAAGGADVEVLMHEKISLEKLRALLAQDSGRVTVG